MNAASIGQVHLAVKDNKKLAVITPKLPPYWLYFVTSTSYKLASALVSSIKVEVICRDNKINDLLGVQPMSYKQALSRALIKVDEDKVASSWKDSLVSGRFSSNISAFRKVPKKDCFIDRLKKTNRKQGMLDKLIK